MSDAPFVRRSEAIAGLVAAALVGSRSPARAQSLTPVRLASILVDDMTPALYAINAGLFRQAGLDVQSTPMSGGAATAAAVLGGSMDIAVSNMVATATAHERGVPLTIASLGSVYNTKAPTVLLFARREAGIQTARDLNGKTIASAVLRDLNMTTTLAWMQQHGGDPTSVHQVEVPYAAQLAALDAGRIDAGVLLAPFSQDALANPKYLAVAHPYDAVAPSFANGVYLTSAQYAAANPDVVQRFSQVIRQASVFANAHHAETAPILAAATSLDVEKILHGTRATYFEALDYGKFQVLLDFFAKNGLLKESFPAQALICAPAATAWR